MKGAFCWRKGTLRCIDSVFFAVVYFATILIAPQTSTSVMLSGRDYFFNACILYAGILVGRIFLSTYSNVWRFANSKTYLRLVIADIIGAAVGLFISWYTQYYIGIWQTVSVVAVFNVMTLSSRFVYQLHYRNSKGNINENNKIGVAIVGAGQSGIFLAAELAYEKHSHYRPICLIDINQEKIGSFIEDLPVYDAADHILDRLNTLPVQEILLALPSLSAEEIGELYHFYSQSNCKVKIFDVPVGNALFKEPQKGVLRDFKIEDLLFREPLKVVGGNEQAFYQNRSILVTGGGGSIGSELCRQMAKLCPKQIIILDSYENNAYDIQQELREVYGNVLDVKVEIASVRDRARLEAIFQAYHPEVVFHAAADKHVPLMEHSQGEAVKTNVFGTYNVADMAEKYHVRKFIMISTDKAVNPTNVMGATKRMCEMIIQSRIDSETSFSAVRFGNVLGSNGSVIPLFQRQIQNGGPVTITDKRIVRYFMTIPEAAQLVIQAGALACRGELFVLDMGKPVKILQLAEIMIELSGLKPYKDIDIIEVGLRPGEKLYEELLMKSETLSLTSNEMIFVEKDTPLSRGTIEEKLMVLRQALQNGNRVDSQVVKQALKKVVSTFQEPDELNRRAVQEEQIYVERDKRRREAQKKVSAKQGLDLTAPVAQVLVNK